MAQLELGRRDVLEVRVEDAQRVQVGDVMPTDLVCMHEQLGLVSVDKSEGC